MKTTHKNLTNTHNDTINTRNNINQTHEKRTTNKTHHEERTQFNPLKNAQYKNRKHETHTKRLFFFGNVNKTMTRNILKKHVKRNNTIKTNHNDATLY